MPGPEPAERLHKVPGRVDKGDLAVIIRAITLYLARNADLDDDCAEKSRARRLPRYVERI